MVLIGIYIVIRNNYPSTNDINSFAECVAAGNLVLESYPRQCHANGQNFVEEIPMDIPSGIANPASEYCVSQGGTVEIRDHASGQVGYCIFEDGSECEEWEYYRGECTP